MNHYPIPPLDLGNPAVLFITSLILITLIITTIWAEDFDTLKLLVIAILMILIIGGILVPMCSMIGSFL